MIHSQLKLDEFVPKLQRTESELDLRSIKNNKKVVLAPHSAPRIEPRVPSWFSTQNAPVLTHGVGQVGASDDGAALLAHFQGQRGRRVALRPVARSAQHRHLDRGGRHGDAVADREGHGVLLGGEAGVLVQQDSAGDVAEGERVAWEERPGSIRLVLDRVITCVCVWVCCLLAKYLSRMDRDETLNVII